MLVVRPICHYLSMRVAQKIGLRYDYEGFDQFNLPTVYYLLHRQDLLPAL
jgi:hypothetical protein